MGKINNEKYEYASKLARQLLDTLATHLGTLDDYHRDCCKKYTDKEVYEDKNKIHPEVRNKIIYKKVNNTLFLILDLLDNRPKKQPVELWVNRNWEADNDN